MTAIIALIFKIIGTGFLLVAAIGVIRFSDAFQRMHAATKAGTLGAGLVVVGTIFSHATAGTTTMGLLTILFLLMTVPVAGHMLGRASYMSGANMAGLKGENALEGVLERQQHSLEERLAWPGMTDPAPEPAREAAGEVNKVAQEAEGAWLNDLSEVKVAIIHGQVETLFPRALAIARANRAHISAHAIIDQKAIETARDPKRTRLDIRARAAAALEQLEAIKSNRRIKLGLVYDEGDPHLLLASQAANGTLLVVPREGWFHHGNDDPRPGMSWEPDGLLQLPQCHRGPVLYSNGTKGRSGKVILEDCGEPHLAQALDWALLSALWRVRQVIVVGCKDEDRKALMRSICERHGVEAAFEDRLDSASGQLSSRHADADALIKGQAPRPLRTRWYGQYWYDRLIPGFSGEILLVCR